MDRTISDKKYWHVFIFFFLTLFEHLWYATSCIVHEFLLILMYGMWVVEHYLVERKMNTREWIFRSIFEKSSGWKKSVDWVPVLKAELRAQVRHASAANTDKWRPLPLLLAIVTNCTTAVSAIPVLADKANQVPAALNSLHRVHCLWSAPSCWGQIPVNCRHHCSCQTGEAIN